jgi:sugar O-acyltransferase (sialic acid O-acetyltransferase NeuD family)
VITNKIILFGGGDHARVVLDCLLDQGQIVTGIFDPRQGGELYGVPQLGHYDPASHLDVQAIVSIGDNQIRKKVVAEIRQKFTNAIHATTVISNRASYGTGNMFLHRAVIQSETAIGNHVIVNTGAQIDHDCKIGNYVHIGPGAILCGTIVVGEGAFIGAGAVVIPGRKIGAWAIIGAGAVIINDIPDHAVAVGNPARIIKYHKR